MWNQYIFIRLEALAASNAKKLLAKLYELPHETCDEGRLAVLPMRQTFPIPRQRKIPSVAPKTRWEKFAQERNIEKRKRSRLVWDANDKDWVPRWGAGSAKNKKRKTGEAIFELKNGEDLRTAVESRRSVAKMVMKKQEYRELRNKVEAVGGRMPRPEQAGIGAVESGKKKGKALIVEAKRRAATSTASRGVYDKPIELKKKSDTRKKSSKKKRMA